MEPPEALRLSRQLWGHEQGEPQHKREPEPPPADGCTTDDLATLPDGRFGCIYADPPWLYGNQGTRFFSRYQGRQPLFTKYSDAIRVNGNPGMVVQSMDYNKLSNLPPTVKALLSSPRAATSRAQSTALSTLAEYQLAVPVVFSGQARNPLTSRNETPSPCRPAPLVAFHHMKEHVSIGRGEKE